MCTFEYMIYFIQSQEHVKVGYTSNLKNRIKKYVTENPHPIKLIGQCKGGYDVEKKIHKELKEYHYRGEWFVYNEEVRQRIYLIIRDNRDNIEPIYKKRTKKIKGFTVDKIYEELKKYALTTGMVDLTAYVRTQIANDLDTSTKLVNMYINLLLKQNKLTRTEGIYYIT